MNSLKRKLDLYLRKIKDNKKLQIIIIVIFTIILLFSIFFKSRGMWKSFCSNYGRIWKGNRTSNEKNYY